MVHLRNIYRPMLINLGVSLLYIIIIISFVQLHFQAGNYPVP